MNLRHWFKKLRKKPESAPGEPFQSPLSAGSSRRPMPPLPSWARQDSFQRDSSEAEGSLEDPMAEQGMIKRPGAWLKKKMNGLSSEQKLQDLEKTQKIYKERKNVADAEMQRFLSDFLGEESEPTEPASPSFDPGKKIGKNID